MPDENEIENEDAAEVTPPEGVEEATDQAVAEAQADEAQAEEAPAAEAAEPEPEAATEDAPEPEAEARAEPEPGVEAEPAPDAGQVAGAPSVKRKKKRLPRPLRRQRPKVTRAAAGERKPITRLPKPERARGRRQERQGVVVSAAADKTIVVRVDVVKLHPVYKKVVRRSTKLHAHDERNEAKPGDVVRVVETRPLSRMKRWRLQEIVEEAK